MWKRLLAPLDCKSRFSRPAPAARSMRPSQVLYASDPTPSLSQPPPSSLTGVSNWPCWRRSTGSPPYTPGVTLWKRAGSLYHAFCPCLRLRNSNRTRRHSPACSWSGGFQAPRTPPSFSDCAIRSTERFATFTYLYRSLARLPRAPSNTVRTQSARSVALWLQAWLRRQLALAVVERHGRRLRPRLRRRLRLPTRHSAREWL